MDPKIVLMSIAGFAVLWCLTVYLISLFSGWKALSTIHENRSAPEGQTFKMQSIIFGKFIGYNNCLTIHVSKKKLTITPWPIFSIGHPPLAFSWKEVRHLKAQKGLFGTTYLYHLGNKVRKKAAFSADVHQAIQKAQMGQLSD